jgi:hypothetical protein
LKHEQVEVEDKKKLIEKTKKHIKEVENLDKLTKQALKDEEKVVEKAKKDEPLVLTQEERHVTVQLPEDLDADLKGKSKVPKESDDEKKTDEEQA